MVKDLIRDRETKAFLTQDGGWTHDPREGREIRSFAEAMAIARDLGSQNLELYRTFLDELPSGEWGFATPIKLPSNLGER